MSKICCLWLTWEVQRRNVSMAGALGADYHCFLSAGGRLRRYLALAWRTLATLFRLGPDVVFCQSPSIVLAQLTTLYGWMRRVPVIVDAHNGGVFPLDRSEGVLAWLARSALRRAAAVIVTNDNLATQLRQWGCTTFVVADPVPEFEAPAADSVAEGASQVDWPTVFIPCSWATDEPIPELMAAAVLSPRVRFQFSGRPRLKRHGLSEAAVPTNVELLGFLSDQEYIRRMSEASAVMVLTRRQDCLVCGGYEGMALSKPLILSDLCVNQDVFPGARLVAVEPSAIAAGVADVLGALEHFGAAMAANRERHKIQVNIAINGLKVWLMDRMGKSKTGHPA